jgi:broad specificity phosphatase PhoE
MEGRVSRSHRFEPLTAVLLGCLLLLGEPRGAQAANEAAPGGEEAAGVAAAPPVALLVRHGEAVPTGRPDRPLSPAGERRAAALAERLAAEGIVRILTTDYPRSRQTAAPLAARLALEPELYDPSDLEGVARELRERRQRVLVVGHSNTTGELAALLGGDSGGPIPDHEHDRLYRVDLVSGATVIERYGEPSHAEGLDEDG